MLCLLLDCVGYLSYAIPVLGELTDVLWAPASAFVFILLFGRKRFGLSGAVFSFIEEGFPGIDFIPTFTIAWTINSIQTLYGGPVLQKSSI